MWPGQKAAPLEKPLLGPDTELSLGPACHPAPWTARPQARILWRGEVALDWFFYYIFNNGERYANRKSPFPLNSGILPDLSPGKSKDQATDTVKGLTLQELAVAPGSHSFLCWRIWFWPGHNPRLISYLVQVSPDLHQSPVSADPNLSPWRNSLYTLYIHVCSRPNSGKSLAITDNWQFRATWCFDENVDEWQRQKRHLSTWQTSGNCTNLGPTS